MSTTIRVKRAPLAKLTSLSFAAGELGYALDTKSLYIGGVDGTPILIGGSEYGNISEMAGVYTGAITAPSANASATTPAEIDAAITTAIGENTPHTGDIAVITITAQDTTRVVVKTYSTSTTSWVGLSDFTAVDEKSIEYVGGKVSIKGIATASNDYVLVADGAGGIKYVSIASIIDGLDDVISDVSAIKADYTAVDSFTYDPALKKLTIEAVDPSTSSKDIDFSGLQSVITAYTSTDFDMSVTAAGVVTAAVKNAPKLGGVEAVNYALKADLGTAAALDVGIAEGDVPVLGEDGKLANSVIPSLALQDTEVCTSEAEMLALTVEKGDLCVRTDISETFILAGADPTILSNWIKLEHPECAVLSVNGKTGAVTLTKADVGLGNVENLSVTEILATITTPAASSNDTTVATTAYVTSAIATAVEVIDGGDYTD